MTYAMKMKYLIYLFPLLLGACSTVNEAYYQMQKSAQGLADPPQTLIDYDRCPAAFVVDELAYFSDYAGASTVPSLKSRAYMRTSNQTCIYDDKSVSVDVTLDFYGELGAKGRSRASDDPLYTYPFFVAITDRGGKIMAKQIFAATIHYPSGGDAGHYSETIRQIIPVPSKAKGRDYAVMAGFQLSDQQLAENRARLKNKAVPIMADAQAAGEAEDMAENVQPVPVRKPDIQAERLNAFAPATLVPAER